MKQKLWQAWKLAKLSFRRKHCWNTAIRLLSWSSKSPFHSLCIDIDSADSKQCKTVPSLHSSHWEFCDNRKRLAVLWLNIITLHLKKALSEIDNLDRLNFNMKWNEKVVYKQNYFFSVVSHVHTVASWFLIYNLTT